MSARLTVWILVGVLFFYLLVAGAQAVTLIGSGEPIAMGLGIGILILPLIGLWIIWREMQFGFGVQKMARELEAEGGLPVDNLPRSEGGSIDRAAADVEFAVVEQATRADSGNWRAWFRVAAAYDAAGDRKRARAAMRYALGVYEGKIPMDSYPPE